MCLNFFASFIFKRSWLFVKHKTWDRQISFGSDLEIIQRPGEQGEMCFFVQSFGVQAGLAGSKKPGQIHSAGKDAFGKRSGSS